MSIETIHVGDRVRFLKNFGPGYGEEGTVVEMREEGSDRWRVKFDKWVSGHDDGREGWWCHSIEKIVVLQDRVIEYLTKPERSNPNTIFEWLGRRNFFGVGEATQKRILADLLASDIVCDAGVKRFKEFLGEDLPVTKQMKVTFNLTIDHPNSDFGSTEHTDCGAIGGLLELLRDAEITVNNGYDVGAGRANKAPAQITKVEWTEYSIQ